ncbi:MAG: hypothetical protein KIS78_20160 [Labilithrix sp.]|nr:hypothetical protein [Labilithrix sp.]MCW5834729.1 hypothetical protein [Labilithrix sp.]
MDWQIPLLVSAVTFAAFLIFRVRPAVTPRARATAAALTGAKKRIEEAKDDAARAIALADAADACAALGRTNGAVGYYLRALRSDPRSTRIVERTAAGLARRPGALERLMWRHLAVHSWEGEHRDAALASLRALAGVYAGRRRHRLRAEAIAHALAALDAERSGG